MDPKIVESELRNHKIREGPIYKRTKFLQEWRERWMVLTMNYILIFTNRNLKELAQFIDLRQVKTYKSYLRKEEDMIPAGFKIRTLQDMFYFCARNCNQKWTWIVSLQRLMDFKYAGKSPYNNADWIKTKGFMGQRQFEKGKFDEPEFYDTPPMPVKPMEVTEDKPLSKTEVSSVTDFDLKNKIKELDNQIAALKQKEEDMQNREREQEQMFLFELNKLKKTEESLRELQIQVQQKAREAQRIIAQGASIHTQNHQTTQSHQSNIQHQQSTSIDNTKIDSTKVEVEDATVEDIKVEEVRGNKVEVMEVIIQNTQQDFEEPLQINEDKPQELLSSQTTGVAVNAQTTPEQTKQMIEEAIDQKQFQEEKPTQMTSSEILSPSRQLQPQTTQQNNQSPKKEQLSPGDSPPSKQVKMSKRISDMKSFFESKQMGPMGPKSAISSSKLKESDKKNQKKDQAVALHMCRDRVVVNLLQEFHSKAYHYAGLRYIIEFLVTICAQRNLGYQSFLIREAKANQNRFLFAEVLLELINDYKKYDQFTCLAKIIEVLIFEAPGIFKLNHFDLIKRKLVDLLNHAPENHSDLPILLKTMYVVHKMKNLQKSEELKAKLISVSDKMISMEGKNWAKKLIEDL